MLFRCAECTSDARQRANSGTLPGVERELLLRSTGIRQKYLVYCIVSYCILLYCIVLYCIVLYCIVLYCIVLHCIALHCIALHCIALHCIVLYCIVLFCLVLIFLFLYYSLRKSSTSLICLETRWAERQADLDQVTLQVKMDAGHMTRDEASALLLKEVNQLAEVLRVRQAEVPGAPKAFSSSSEWEGKRFWVTGYDMMRWEDIAWGDMVQCNMISDTTTEDFMKWYNVV